MTEPRLDTDDARRLDTDDARRLDDDARWLARAIGLGALAARTSRPNPPVGCVLVRDGEVVGEGWTRPVGGPHAEVVALADAGDAARGATAYVTLEPCDHTGRTGPCTRALLAAGVARVVYGEDDPGPRAGGGAATLAAAGVEVVGAVHPERWEQALHEAWSRDTATGLPLVTLKLAVTRDGATVAADGRWITGTVARRRVHRQRAAADAVLVGSGTVLADDPGLDVRHVDTPSGQPRPVVLDTRLRTGDDAGVVARGALVVAGPDVPDERRRALEAAGATVVTVPVGEDGRLDPYHAMQRVRGADAEQGQGPAGAQVVYAEPGPTLGAALLRADLVQHVLVHVGGVTPTEALEVLADVPLPLDGWEVTDVVRLGDDVEIALVPPRHRT